MFLPRLLTLLSIALLSTAAFCASVYKYKDENGKWVFSDKPPKESAQYTKEKLTVTEVRKKVTLVNRGTKKRPILYAVNQLHGPIQLTIDLDTVNMSSSHQGEPTWIIPALSDKQLLVLERIKHNDTWRYKWSGNLVLGAPVESPKDYAYGVPFKGGPYIISQGYHGKISHSQHPTAFYAIDFALPLRTPIIAARGGIVMDTETHFSRTGWDDAYIDEANLVRILHDDGSMAVYAHLSWESILVEGGARVKKGQTIAYSGNTGYSTGPHLHFSIQINNGEALVSIPFHIAGYATPLSKGMVIRGPK